MRNAHAIATLVCLVGSAAYTSISAQAQAERGKASPQAHLNRAADAVLRLKSAQFTLTREGAPAFLDEKNGVTFTAAQCSYAAPDRVSCNVKVSSKTGSTLRTPVTVFKRIGKNAAKATMNTFIPSSIPRPDDLG